MVKSNITCYYHPTTIVFVDDNKSFLDNILLELDENINACSFTDPTKAIEYIKNHQPISIASKCLKSLKENENSTEINIGNIEHGYVDIDVSNIYKEIYNPARFSTVIVVIVDYTMPGMNGLNFCQALRDLPLKFVLITGDATLANAIEAFNAGLIHQFIPKSINKFIDKLQEVICELQQVQFKEFSEVIINNLATQKTTILSDPLFSDFFKNFLQKNNIIEYYLVNKSGCFLLANAIGELSWLIIKSEEEMLEYTNAAIDNYGKGQVIEALQSREKLLFLYTEKDHVHVAVDKWEEFLYKATRFVGKNNTYYYSHIKDKIGKKILIDKVISYDHFLITK